MPATCAARSPVIGAPIVGGQAVHSLDAANAYRIAITREVRAAFNIAAEPVVDSRLLGEVLRTRAVEVPPGIVRAAAASAWHVRLVPAAPALIDLVMQLPLMDTTRARSELGWIPERSSAEALEEILEGLSEGAGAATAPLAPTRPPDDSRRSQPESGHASVGPHRERLAPRAVALTRRDRGYDENMRSEEV